MTLTKQDIFTKVWNHLKQQGQPASENDRCKYRTLTGLSCAVGCLLDDAAAKKLDRVSSPAIGHVPHLLPEALRPHIQLLAELQDAHDVNSNDHISEWLKDWPRRMRFIAAEHNLEVPQ